MRVCACMHGRRVNNSRPTVDCHKERSVLDMHQVLCCMMPNIHALLHLRH